VPESAAHRFHRLTSYSLDRHWLVPADDVGIRQDFLPLDEACLPARQKVYPADLPRVPLPASFRADSSVGGELLSGCRLASDNAAPFDLAELSWLMHWSAGIVRRRVSRSGRPVWFRAASSAGNRQPIEAYLQARGVIGLPDGSGITIPPPMS
jgi:hypothetical protein